MTKDQDFAHLFPKWSRPAEALWHMALVTVLQAIEGGHEVSDFHLDWSKRRAICPQGQQSQAWSRRMDEHTQPIELAHTFLPGNLFMQTGEMGVIIKYMELKRRKMSLHRFSLARKAESIDKNSYDALNNQSTSNPSTLYSRRRPWFLRSGLRRRTIVFSVILALFFLVLDNTFAVSDSILALIIPPKVLTSAPASDLFYFQTSPSWGTVSLDGHWLSHLPAINRDSPIHLMAGTHQIEWQTEPFQPMKCLLIIPAEKDLQACPMRLLTHPNSFTPSALLVTPPQSFSLRLLPSAQRQKLITITQQRLDTLQSTDTVQPGEVYQPDPNMSSFYQATQPLQATLRFILDTDTSLPAHCQGISLSYAGDAPCFVAKNDCRLFCTLQWSADIATGAQSHWDVAAIVRTLRTYTPSETPQKAEIGETQQFVTFRISWDQGTWHVSFHQPGDSFFDDPACQHTISVLITDPRYHSTVGSHWTYTSGSNRAQGCVAVMQPDEPSPVASPPSLTGIILFDRSGVLLTASALASQRWSKLPAASAHEQNLAEEILLHPAFVS